MKTLLLLLSLMSLSAFANPVEKVYHLTYTTATQKCAVDVVILTSGKVKTERTCFNLSK